MALTVEELQVIISANADQFKGELLSIKGELQKLGRTSDDVSQITGGNLFGNILKANLATDIITGTITRAASAMSGLIGEIIEGGSQYSRLKIATDTVTANLGITSDQVKELRDNLADANTYGINAENVIRTLALSGLVKMAEGLEAVDARTGETVKGVTALTLAMKDLGAANALDSSEAIDRISKFIQRGEAAFADGLIEIGDINREYSEYARQVGKTSDTLTALERAQVRLNIVMREGQKTYGAYANTYQTSGKAFASIRDILKSLAQQIGGTLEPILRVAGNAILQFFQGIRSFLGDSETAIGDFANKIAGYMVALIRLTGRLLMMLPGIGKYFAGLANFSVKPIQAAKVMTTQMGKAATGVDGLGESMDATGAKAKKLKDSLAGFDEMNVLNQDTGSSDAGSLGAPAFDGSVGGDLGLGDSSEQIMKYADQAEKAIDGLLNPITDFLDRLKKITIFGKPVVDILGNIAKVVGIGALAWAGLSTALGWITPLIMPIVSGFSTILGVFAALTPAGWLVVGVIAAIAAAFTYAWTTNEEFRNSVTETVGQVVAKVQELVGVFMERLPEIQKALKPVTDFLGKVFAVVVTSLGNTIIWLWNAAIKPWIDNMLTNAVPNLNKFIDALIFTIDTGVKIADFIGSILGPVFSVLGQVFSVVWNSIASIVSWAWNSVLMPAFNNMASFITGFVIPVVSNLWLIFSTVFNAIASLAQSVWGAIFNAIKPVIDWIWTAIAPAVNFMKDRFIEAFNAIASVASGIWSGISNAFKVGINAIIDNINRFINGINSMITSVNNAGATIPGWTNINYRVGTIPKLAMGGSITGPTLAELGEQNYNEVVLPLERNTGWAEQVAELINGNLGDAQQGATVVVKLGEKTIFEDFVEYINDRSLTTNKPLLNL